MKSKNILLAIGLNIIITLSEVVIGILSGSLAILSDAIHNFLDVGSMVFSWWGEKVSNRKGDIKRTYGFKRAEILVALFNSSLLIVSVGFIAVEALKRLAHPEPINGSFMLVTATIAFFGNLINHG